MTEIHLKLLGAEREVIRCAKRWFIIADERNQSQLAVAVEDLKRIEREVANTTLGLP